MPNQSLKITTIVEERCYTKKQQNNKQELSRNYYIDSDRSKSHKIDEKKFCNDYFIPYDISFHQDF